jgi:predicted enzyme related to lactoylglutathione lyase
MASQIPHGSTLDANFMFTKLEVSNLDQSAAFYTSVFGLVEMHRVEAAITGRPVSEVVYMPTYAGGPMFILAKFHDAATPTVGELILGFAVKDMEALIERATVAGGRLLERIEAAGGAPFHTAFIADPEGHVIQLSAPVA